MKHLLAATALAAAGLTVASPATAQSSYGSRPAEEVRFEEASQRFDRELRTYREAFDRYQEWRARNPTRGGGWNNDRNDRNDRWDDDYRDDPNYDPARYYRSGPNYQERVLGPDDRVYRGNDGRYYCRRSDGTTGLIVGAAAGGLFGNVIAGRRSSTVGTILGAIAGGALGASIDRNQQVRCR